MADSMLGSFLHEPVAAEDNDDNQKPQRNTYSRFHPYPL
jgi:hypothetical protein